MFSEIHFEYLLQIYDTTMKNILVLYYRCWCIQIAHKHPVTRLKRRAVHPRLY